MQSMAVPGVAKIQGKGAVLIQVCGVRIMAAGSMPPGTILCPAPHSMLCLGLALLVADG